jgi:hypothetical protein
MLDSLYGIAVRSRTRDAMSYMKRSIALDTGTASEPTGTPTLTNRKTEPMGRGRPPLEIWSVVPTELNALMDAVESAGEEGSGFDLLDIERVEAFWQQIELHSTAHGFVLTLRDGTRVYVQYITATDDEKPVEDIVVLLLGGERYPDLRGTDLVWDDDTGELNRFLHG